MPRAYKENPAKQVATGQPYGQAKAQREAMQDAPLPDQDAQVAELAKAMPFQPIGMGAPGPGEQGIPETAGLPFGPGADRPSPLQPMTPPGPDDDQVKALVAMLPLLERIAASPNSTAATRRIVRAVRREIATRRPLSKGA